MCIILVRLIQYWICETDSDKCMSKIAMPLFKYVILNMSNSANLLF